MRALLPFAALAALLPSAAFAADCAPLQLLSSIQMARVAGDDTDTIPVTINGTPENFLFDTGGFLTAIGRPAAEKLKLTVRQGNITMYDMRGVISRDQTGIDHFGYGTLFARNITFPISPNVAIPAGAFDGIFAPDELLRYDVEMDFSTDTLNLYSQDHCGGLVPAGPKGAEVPLLIRDRHLTIPVMLDGREIRASIDTGASYSSLRMDDARYMYKLTMGSPDTPQNGILNDAPDLKTYSHVFNSLSFGDISVSNPRLAIVPNAMGRNADPAPLVYDRTKTERDLVNAPELIIGMDILRRLHLFLALGEDKLYAYQTVASEAQMRAAQAALPIDQLQGLYRKYALEQIGEMTQRLGADARNVHYLNDRCFVRAAIKIDLAAALADCDLAIKLQPDEAGLLDSRAFALYQLGQYSEALAGYNAALALEPKLAASLFMRGYTRGKLGDAAGMAADLAAAKAVNPDIASDFRPYDIDY